MDIIAQRGTGVAAPDIIDPLLATISVALERGRVELDTYGVHGVRESLLIVYRPNIERGMTVEVQDSLQGVSWRGVIKGITHTSRGGIPTTRLQLDRFL